LPDSEQSSAKFSTQLATDQAQRFRESSDRIRERTDLAAKSLGGLALTGLTAIGIAKITDVFPLPPDTWMWLIPLFGGFLLMAFAVAIFMYRLWNVAQKIVLRPDPEQMTDVTDKGQKAELRKIYSEFAELNDVPSLRAYVARAHRWQRIADSLTPNAALAQTLRDRAQLALAEVLATETRAGMILARRRASEAIKGPWAIGAYVGFLVGVLAFGIGADRIDSERSQRVTVAQACATAKTAGANSLPDICGTSTETPSTMATTPGEIADQGTVDVATSLQKCLAAARKTQMPASTCEPLRAALMAAAQAP
jgi:hypothetical protein